MQQFAAIVKPNPEDGGFILTVSGNPNVVGWGVTEEAALENARTALESTPEAAGGGLTSGTEDPEGALRSFDSPLDLEALATEQGVEPAGDFDALLDDFCGANEFVIALRTWRHDNIEIVEHRPKTVTSRTP